MRVNLLVVIKHINPLTWSLISLHGSIENKWIWSTFIFFFEYISDPKVRTCMMSHLFSKKAKADTELPPQPPTIDQIVEDLEAAKPDDIVFTTDIGLVDVDLSLIHI